MRVEDMRKYQELTPEQLKAFWTSEKGMKFPFSYTFLHTHTDLGSPKDSVLTVSDYVRIAREMGAGSLSVTDHGTMYGVQALYDEVTKSNKNNEWKMKLIIGIEFYVCEDVGNKDRKKQTRLHLIAYAKDMDGYRAIARLVTESNKRIIVAGENSYPCISKELLKKYVGPGSSGHGHVILTSACVGGVLTGICYANHTAQMNLSILDEKIAKYRAALDGYASVQETLSGLEDEKMNLVSISKKVYGKRTSSVERAIKAAEKAVMESEAMDGTASETAKSELAAAQAALSALNAEKAESERAKEEVKKLAKRIAANKRQLTAFKAAFPPVDADVEENADAYKSANIIVSRLEAERKLLAAEIFDEKDAPGIFEKELLWYKDLVGEDWYVELQNHGIDEEIRYMPIIAKLARKHGIKVVAANDAHMPTRESVIARKIVSGLRFRNIKSMWEEPKNSDYELYLKSDAELYLMLASSVGEQVAMEAMMNRKYIVDACNVELKKEGHYPVYTEVA